MSSLMFRKLSFLFEALAAIVAFKRLLTRMDSQVVLQIASLVKLSLTHSTHKDGVESLRDFIDNFSFKT